jgi:hypothetical protein
MVAMQGTDYHGTPLIHTYIHIYQTYEVHIIHVSTRMYGGLPKSRSSTPGRNKRFLFSKIFRPAMGPLSLLYNWHGECFPVTKS